MDPARIFTESLTPRPELENSQGHSLPGQTKQHVQPCPLFADRYRNGQPLKPTRRARRRGSQIEGGRPNERPSKAGSIMLVATGTAPLGTA